jgi:hypothetical protein
MGSVPFPVVVVVMMIIATFVTCVTATQGKYHSAEKENEAQYVFYCVLHKKSGFKVYCFENPAKRKTRVKRGLVYD